MGFSGGSVGKESACNAGDTGDAGSIPGSGRSLGEENGSPRQYSCLGKSHEQKILIQKYLYNADYLCSISALQIMTYEN